MLPPTTFTITGGRIIDPASGVDAVGSLVVRAGVIEDVRMGDSPVEGSRVDASGLIVAPGLVDLHVHLREPGQTHKEDIETGSRAAAAGGFTTVCCMPNTSPPLDTVAALVAVRRRAQEVGLCRVHAVAAATVGRAGKTPVDFAALASAGAVAFSDDGEGVEDDAVCAAVMEGIQRVDSMFFPHCEFQSLSRRGAVHLGPVSERLGLVGYDPRGEEAMIERDLQLVERIGVRYHVAHISTAKGIALVADAKRRNLPVTTEVCPHHLLLCDEDVIRADGKPDPNFKMSPPLRSRSDRDACVAGLRNGTIDCIVTDHAPHTAFEKSGAFERAPMGIVGLETSLGCAALALIKTESTEHAGAAPFGWRELITRMSTIPAQLLRLSGGTLRRGTAADVVLIDPAKKWTVAAEQFHSRSRNTPFAGWALTGRAVMTLLGGRMTHLDAHERARLVDKSDF